MSEQPETIMRGMKIRLYPRQEQAQRMDLWRRRTINLWNLLLGMEMAAYSGENSRSKLGWRSIWAQVVEESHATAVQVAREGKRKRDGTVIKEAGARAEPPPLDPVLLAKIQRRNGEDEPKLFIWEHELQKIMARLKQVPRSEWIADLPSHAAQAVVKDLIKALQNMLRERKKRLSGANARDTGFPKFKKSRYAAGSVYLANTQFRFDTKTGRVKLPNGVGAVRYDSGGPIDPKAKLMGGRLWRQGEDWFLSCQWQMPTLPPLPLAGRTAGVKIAGKILLTTYDDRGHTREYTMPPPDPRLALKHKRAGQKLARVLAGQKRREKKLQALGRNVKPGKSVRLQRSNGFYKASARLAKLEAEERDRRDDFLHKLTTDVLRKFDAISVQKMDVAEMMKKPATKRKRRQERLEAAPEGENTAPARRRPMKPVRKLLRHVAMGRCRQLLEYKFRDAGRGFEEIDRLDPQAQTCSSCGQMHPEMKDGRRMIVCDCGTVLPRTRNAARNAERLLKLKRMAGEKR